MILTKREHACLVIERDGASLVIDPGSFTAPFDAPGLVAIVVTHEHADHAAPEHLDRLLASSPEARLFAPAGVAAAHPGYDWQIVAAGDVREAAPFTLAFSGGRHAVIHASIPVVDNLGVMVDGTLYYPGDSYTDPGVPVGVLAVPASAPWLKIGEVMDYLDAVRPRRAFPTHERANSDAGNAMANGRIKHVVESNGGRFFALVAGDTLEI
ncbi:MBL fold metallo-hydrolase [Microcella alkalica]|uniref:L-ascorbate metabolism protein UlaG (Beta-lactamase superfamily) n=1 Tax=Microcella alkalica TaxID=355930 RepID=A0A839E5C9_9MICO|nr:MBL fold metallo-hydrolase [Microcella alkalica]MBA8846556.1 L-ascorbate metabolism protein UlaG (beta-lactamase superfamily) [Microcella alkalica]